MRFYFVAGLTITFFSLIVLLMQDYGTLNYTASLISLVCGLVVTFGSVIIIRKRK